jgi:transcriptional regulator with XRE-family HTH domain
MTGQHADSGSELGRFLRARREQITPEQVGLTRGPRLRRTPGLRREELATLAGVSVDYYTRLERGKETRPSPSVIDALSRALRLEEAEHDHLVDLALRAARTAPERPIAPSRSVNRGVQLIVEALRPFAAHVVGRSHDVLAANPAGLRLLAGLDTWPAKERNISRYVFLHPAARDLFDDWDNQVRSCVGYLRALAATEPDAPDLAQLVGELLVKSPDFARLWERYDIRGHSYGRKTFHHPDVGDLTLGYQVLQLVGTPGQHLITYYAEQGTAEYDALVLLDHLGANELASVPRGQSRR